MVLRNERIQRLVGRGPLMQLSVNFVSTFQLAALESHKDKDVIKLIRRVRKECRSLITGFEAFFVYSVAGAQRHRDGVMAEVGVYRGGSARLISEAKGDVPLHLFDTFEGLPEPTEAEQRVHREHQFTCDLETVKTNLEGYSNVHFHPGRFPETGTDVQDEKFSFAHFDVDLYESTLGCLEFFYPRMVPGGIMLSHDYSILTGVKQAFDEFLADKPEQPIELPTTQCMIFKL